MDDESNAPPASGDYQRIIAERKAFVDEAPGDTKARMALANTYSALGMEEKAIAQYEQVLDQVPDHAEARCLLAVAMQFLGMRYLNQAVHEYERAIEADPTLRKAHFNYLQALSLTGGLHKGISAYKARVRENVAEPANYLYLGFACTLSGDLERAEQAVRAGLGLAPADPYLHNALGDVCARQERTDEAVAAWEKALECEREFLDARYSLAEAYELRGRNEDARHQWRQIIGFLDERPGAELALAEARQKLTALSEGRSS